jgi:hypothetical protein
MSVKKPGNFLPQSDIRTGDRRDHHFFEQPAVASQSSHPVKPFRLEGLVGHEIAE